MCGMSLVSGHQLETTSSYLLGGRARCRHRRHRHRRHHHHHRHLCPIHRQAPLEMMPARPPLEGLISNTGERDHYQHVTTNRKLKSCTHRTAITTNNPANTRQFQGLQLSRPRRLEPGALSIIHILDSVRLARESYSSYSSERFFTLSAGNN